MLNFRFNITYLCRGLKEQTETLTRVRHRKVSRSLGSTKFSMNHVHRKSLISYGLHPSLCLQSITALVTYLKCLPQIQIQRCANRNSKIVMSKTCRWRWKKGWASIRIKLTKVKQSKTAVLDARSTARGSCYYQEFARHNNFPALLPSNIPRKQEPAWCKGIVLACCQGTSSKTTTALELKESLTWGDTAFDPEDVDSCRAHTCKFDKRVKKPRISVMVRKWKESAKG